MFVGDTFLSCFDRFSAKSVVYGANGTLCGVLGSLGLIAVCVILYYGAVIDYINGDYIQGTYRTLNNQDIQLITGKNFKMSLAFFNRTDNQVVDLQTLTQNIQTKIIYRKPQSQTYYLYPLPCQKQYFGQQYTFWGNVKASDCYTLPNNIKFQSQALHNYNSVLGFSLQPLCNNPFACVANSQIYGQKNTFRLNFFTQHYFTITFSSSYLDHWGNLKHSFYQIYSSQWQGRQSPAPIVYINQQKAKVYLDNSIMPWINNKTLVYSQWLGETNGQLIDKQKLQMYGTGAYVAFSPIQRIYVREYKKLDWLLGIVGGGLMLLYIIFWVPCNYLATVKQRIEHCQSIILLREGAENFSSMDDSKKPSFLNPLWYLTQLFRLNLKKCFLRENRSIHCSQKFLDIADLVKKVKVTVKNLNRMGKQLCFQQRILQFHQQNQVSFTQQQKKLQLKNQVVQNLKKDEEIQKIYNNHLPMLATINDTQGNNTALEMRMQSIINLEKYSKFNYSKFSKSEKSCYRLFRNLWNLIVKFFTFFDAFGAKPNLCGSQDNSTIFGCFLTSVTVIASILTCCLTIANMSTIKVYFDQIYIGPADQRVQIQTGQNFRLAFCFPESAFTNNQIVTGNRVADIKFYQYTRKNQQQVYRYYRMIPVEYNDLNYFDITSPVYNRYDFHYCFQPENNIKVQTYGTPQAQEQAYIGVKLQPYCSDLSSQCANTKQTINSNFWNFINTNEMTVIYPESIYYPQEGQVKINPMGYVFPKSSTMNMTAQQSFYLDTLQIIDDWASWVVSDLPSPRQQYFTSNSDYVPQNHLQSKITDQPCYIFKIRLSGKVSRVIISSYKLDFLLATIGGCFVIFSLIFGCFGKAYNSYNLKLRLVQTLYGQQTSSQMSKFKAFLTWIGMVCCKDPILEKIQGDMQCVRLAKNIDNIYRLSTARYNNPLQKDLALIYLKQRIKEDDQIKTKAKFVSGEQIQNRLNQQIYMPELTRQNISQNNQQLINAQVPEKQMDNYQSQVAYCGESNRNQANVCAKLINHYDLFKNNAQYTLNGKRSIKSMCGGIFCLLLLVFICLLVYHFVSLYFSQWQRVSLEKITDQNSQNLKMQFKVGQNLKLGLSFYRQDDFNFADVENITNNVGFSLVKYKIQQIQGRYQTTNQIIDLQNCKSDYLDRFTINTYSKQYYSDISKGFCVPDGTQLNLYGSASDQTRQYFGIRIYNKQGPNSTSLSQVQALLSNYLVRYHVSTSVVDFRAEGGHFFEMRDVLKSSSYQTIASRTYNITLVKNIIKFDTSMNVNNEKPEFFSYEIKQSDQKQYISSVNENTDRYCDLNFRAQDIYNQYTIKTIKVYEIFGIIGGCIAILFFGLGSIPRSFNEYRMRYLIGTKLYVILGKKKKRIRNSKGKKFIHRDISNYDLQQFSELRLLFAWFCSFISFPFKNYALNNTIKYVALIQSRVSQDINIFQIMKTIFSCQKALKEMTLTSTKLNLCNVFTKQVIPIYKSEEEEQQRLQLTRKLVQQVENRYPNLLQVAKLNKFTEWQLKIILTAKQKGIDFGRIFKQKWLDSFAEVVRSRSEMSSSAFQSQSSTSSNINQSQLKSVQFEGDSYQNLKIQKKVENRKNLLAIEEQKQNQQIEIQSNLSEKKNINRIANDENMEQTKQNQGQGFDQNYQNYQDNRNNVKKRRRKKSNLLVINERQDYNLEQVQIQNDAQVQYDNFQFINQNQHQIQAPDSTPLGKSDSQYTANQNNQPETQNKERHQ